MTPIISVMHDTVLLSNSYMYKYLSGNTCIYHPMIRLTVQPVVGYAH